MKSTICAVTWSALALLSLVPAPARCEDVVIVQRGQKFSRTEVTLKAGDRLVFRNADDFSHNLFSVSNGAQFGTYMQEAGSTTTVPVSKEGTFEVQCAIHPKMKLEVTVHK